MSQYNVDHFLQSVRQIQNEPQRQTTRSNHRNKGSFFKKKKQETTNIYMTDSPMSMKNNMLNTSHLQGSRLISSNNIIVQNNSYRRPSIISVNCDMPSINDSESNRQVTFFNSHIQSIQSAYIYEMSEYLLSRKLKIKKDDLLNILSNMNFIKFYNLDYLPSLKEFLSLNLRRSWEDITLIDEASNERMNKRLKLFEILCKYHKNCATLLSFPQSQVFLNYQSIPSFMGLSDEELKREFIRGYIEDVCRINDQNNIDENVIDSWFNENYGRNSCNKFEYIYSIKNSIPNSISIHLHLKVSFYYYINNQRRPPFQEFLIEDFFQENSLNNLHLIELRRETMPSRYIACHLSFLNESNQQSLWKSSESNIIDLDQHVMSIPPSDICEPMLVIFKINEEKPRMKFNAEIRCFILFNSTCTPNDYSDPVIANYTEGTQDPYHPLKSSIVSNSRMSTRPNTAQTNVPRNKTHLLPQSNKIDSAQSRPNTAQTNIIPQRNEPLKDTQTTNNKPMVTTNDKPVMVTSNDDFLNQLKKRSTAISSNLVKPVANRSTLIDEYEPGPPLQFDIDAMITSVVTAMEPRRNLRPSHHMPQETNNERQSLNQLPQTTIAKEIPRINRPIYLHLTIFKIFNLPTFKFTNQIPTPKLFIRWTSAHESGNVQSQSYFSSSSTVYANQSFFTPPEASPEVNLSFSLEIYNPLKNNDQFKTNEDLYNFLLDKSSHTFINIGIIDHNSYQFIGECKLDLYHFFKNDYIEPGTFPTEAPIDTFGYEWTSSSIEILLGGGIDPPGLQLATSSPGVNNVLYVPGKESMEMINYCLNFQLEVNRKIEKDKRKRQDFSSKEYIDLPFGLDLSGKSLLVCRFLYEGGISLPPLTDDGNFPKIETPSYTLLTGFARKYVALIPFVSDVAIFENVEDLWCDSQSFIDIGAGDWEEHALLLINFLVYIESNFGDNLYSYFAVVVNALPDGSDTVYVLKVLNENSSIFELINPKTGKTLNKIETQSSRESITSGPTGILYIKYCFNYQQVYYFIGRNCHNLFSWNFKDSSNWKPLFKQPLPPEETGTSWSSNPGVFEMNWASQISKQHHESSIINLKSKIVDYVEAKIVSYRAKNGFITRVDSLISKSLDDYLISYDAEYLSGNESDIFIKIATNVSQQLPNLESIIGSPIRLSWRDSLEVIWEEVLSSHVCEIPTDSVVYGIGVHCVRYGSFMAVWIFVIACI